jgi:hypothetical protein
MNIMVLLYISMPSATLVADVEGHSTQDNSKSECRPPVHCQLMVIQMVTDIYSPGPG